MALLDLTQCDQSQRRPPTKLPTVGRGKGRGLMGERAHMVMKKVCKRATQKQKGRMQVKGP